jgi:hypothetical protein
MYGHAEVTKILVNATHLQIPSQIQHFPYQPYVLKDNGNRKQQNKLNDKTVHLKQQPQQNHQQNDKKQTKNVKKDGST